MFRSQLRKNYCSLTQGDREEEWTQEPVTEGDRGCDSLPGVQRGHITGALAGWVSINQVVEPRVQLKPLLVWNQHFLPFILHLSFLSSHSSAQNCLPSLLFYRKHPSAVITVFSTFFHLWIIMIIFDLFISLSWNYIQSKLTRQQLNAWGRN